MNKTKIDWADMTWNPVTGCLNSCPYCYARKIAIRFGKHLPLPDGCKTVRTSGLLWSGKKMAFPYDFTPTLHLDRLDEPSTIKKPQNIFVCSMADLFGEWVPDKWIQTVFKACEAAPQHRYLFLTKNPDRYDQLNAVGELPATDNFWHGSTVTKPKDNYCTDSKYQSFLSVEPIHQSFGHMWKQSPGVEWVIVGAETGNRKGKVIPEFRWVYDLMRNCHFWGVPIFMKESLRSLMGADFIQEYPWEVKP